MMTENPESKRAAARITRDKVLGVLALIAVLSVAGLLSRIDENKPSGQIRKGETGYLRSHDGGKLILYGSQDGMSKVTQLIRAGADDSLLSQYVACMVPNNTKVLDITGEISSAFMSGFGHTRDVMVVAGPQAGCRGVVDDKWVKN